MTQPKISIIIPVFNTQNYLRQCLESVIHQTLIEIEIICINDGSTDNSLSILNEYSAKDNRVIIVDKDNGGQGLARNLGIEKATGEYLGFVDSDDWVDPNMFSYLYASAKKFEADVTLCEFQHFEDEKGKIPQTPWLKLPLNRTFDDRAFKWEDIRNTVFEINSGSVNKIYKKDFVLRHHIEFATGLHYEDILFVFRALINAEKISIVRKPLYFYRYTRSGSVSSDKGRKQFDIFIILNKLREALSHDHKFDDLKVKFYEYMFNQYFYHCIETGHECRKEFWNRIKAELYQLETEVRKSLTKHRFLLNQGMQKGLLLYKFFKYGFMIRNIIYNYFSPK